MSVTHIVLLLLVVVLIFGTKKLRHMGSDLGGAMRDFKRGLNGTEDDTPAALADVARAGATASNASHTPTASHPIDRNV